MSIISLVLLLCWSYFLNCFIFVQEIKADVTKSDKSAATAAATKQNALDIVSITSDGCEMSFILLYMHAFTRIYSLCQKNETCIALTIMLNFIAVDLQLYQVLKIWIGLVRFQDCYFRFGSVRFLALKLGFGFFRFRYCSPPKRLPMSNRQVQA